MATSSAAAQLSTPSTIYTLTNDTQSNGVEVGVYAFGSLFRVVIYPTGGTGTAASLGSQGALATSADGRLLVAVNPGSDDVTLFRTFAGLLLVQRDIASTRGDQPTSAAIHGDLVYVLNSASDDITGFRLRGDQLEFIGTFPLSQSGAMGSTVGFDPSGRFLVATERATNRILVFPVQADGALDAAVVNASAGETPFGFSFRGDGTLIVSEAAGGQPNDSTVSSYEIEDDGTLQPISGATRTSQTAACWIAIPRGGRYAYTTNTGSGSITGYRVDRFGQLGVLTDTGVTADLGSMAAPIDFDFDASGRLLFVLDSAGDRILVLRRDPSGGLTPASGMLSLPDGAAGLIAH